MSAICQVEFAILATSSMDDRLMFARIRMILCAIAIAAISVAPSGVTAQSRDHDAVRAAVARGEIRPLAEILAIVRSKVPGEVAKVEIKHKNGLWIYEFRIVGDKGRLFEIYVDARRGKIERIKEK